MRINVLGVPKATARHLLRRPNLWFFPTLVMIGVSVVVSLSYIGGIINPTGNLHHLPIAIVDEDQAVHVDGRKVHLGPKIVRGITTASDSRQRVEWQTLSLREAEAEMDKDAVYGALIIPADFSSGVLSLTGPVAPHGTAPRQPSVHLLTNPRSGSVATSSVQAVGERTTHTVSSRIAGTLAAHVEPAHHTSRRAIPTAERILLADPVTLHTSEHRPLGNHSGFGLSAFYVSLVLTLGAYLGAGVVSSSVDFALGYQSAERGRRWSSKLPVPITRTQTLVAKTAMSAVLSPVTATAILLTCKFALHMDTPHFGQLWIYSVCASIAVGVTAQTIISLVGGLGSLVGMLFFVALAVPSSGGSFPLQTVPSPYRWLAGFEPMRQIDDGVRAILYFDARGDAGLTRGWIMIALGCFVGLALGLIVAWIRDHGGHQRLTSHQITAAHAHFRSTVSLAAPAGSTQHESGGRPALRTAAPDRRNATEPTPHSQAAPRVFGRVRNSYGDVVSLAAITLLSLNGSQLGRIGTQSDGSYEIDAPASGPCLLLATAHDHQPHAAIVQIGDRSRCHDVVLNGLSGTVPV
ncbi:YhgE/Pip domain-containing protein [Streptomyces sp. NPDC003996]